ncbi:plasmid transfer protein [Pedobacter polaris]|uniref:plasmid transfer protein n=1 Tax=Pedobacter polaris TaxID=2571273 RepID=UPI00145D7649|nr:plasmid transfer protein [Pedobacter polaris]
MAKQFSVYKGLQKPLIYKGFKGKFIYWGIGVLLLALVFGSLTMALVNKYLGGFVLVGIIVGGLFYTAGQQKKGLYSKTKYKGIFLYAVNLRRISQYEKRNRI